MSIERFIKQGVTGWMTSEGEHADIVMSTRIRLARNLVGFRMPLSFSEDEAHQVEQQVTSVLLEAGPELDTNFTSLRMNDVQPLQRQVLVEKHLISPQLANPERPGSVILSDDETISVMVNEEDHIRIQVLSPGLQLMEAYQKANQVDNILEKDLPYAFDERFGYTTTCPTNTGTGLRASVMMHLPALTITNRMSRIIPQIARLGMVVRGIYGEGTEALGNIYQVSNQITLGKSEEDILTDLLSIAEQIIQEERTARHTLMTNSPTALEDRLYRSLGVLSYARLLSTDEAAKCLSDVRLGIDLKLIQDIDMSILNELMIFMQPAFLQEYADTELKPRERDVFRAKLFRERLQMDHRKKGETGGE